MKRLVAVRLDTVDGRDIYTGLAHDGKTRVQVWEFDGTGKGREELALAIEQAEESRKDAQKG